MTVPDLPPVDVVANVATLVVLVGGFVLTRPAWIRFSLAWARWRCLRDGPGLVAHHRRVRDLALDLASPADEVDWLAGTLDRHGDRALPSVVDAEGLARLAAGYRRLAARLESRLILGSNVEIVSGHRDLASRTSDLITGLSVRTDRAAVEHDEDSPRDVTNVGTSRVEWLVGPGSVPGHAAFDLSVSYRHHATYADYPGSPWASASDLDRRAMTLDADERERVRQRMSGTSEHAHVFDGLLPRLRGWSVLRDPDSGRAVLSLELAACSYGSVVADHHRGAPADGVDERGRRVGVITLSCVPLTRDRRLVLTQRSDRTDTHRGAVAPGVNGNLELSARRGVGVDRDERGCPDPLLALVREGREELGIELVRSRLFVVGLTRFFTPSEGGTFNLLATAPLDVDFDQLRTSLHQADLVEGRWEVGRRLLGIRLPTSDDDDTLVQQVRWLTSEPTLTPHARAGALSALSSWTGRLDLIDAATQTPHEASATPPPWLDVLTLD